MSGNSDPIRTTRRPCSSGEGGAHKVKDGSHSDVIDDAKAELPMLRQDLELVRAAFKASK